MFCLLQPLALSSLRPPLRLRICSLRLNLGLWHFGDGRKERPPVTSSRQASFASSNFLYQKNKSKSDSKERKREGESTTRVEKKKRIRSLRERERDGRWWWWRIWEAMVVVTNDDGWERWRWWWWRVNERWWWWWRAEGEMVVVVRRSNVMDWTRRGVTERERFACVFFWSNEICVLG